MLQIKKFEHKHVCNARRCKELNVFKVGPVGEHPMFSQFYCADHLLEIAERANEFFGIGNAEPSELEKETFEELKATVAKLQESLETPNPIIAELQAENEQLKARVIPVTSESDDIDQLKAELLSVKATSELFKENIEKLTAENNKLKQAPKPPIKKPQPAKKKGR